MIDPGIDTCVARNKSRPDRPFGVQVVQRMTSEIRRGLGGLQREGFRQVWKFTSEADVAAAMIERRRSGRTNAMTPGPSTLSATCTVALLSLRSF